MFESFEFGIKTGANPIISYNFSCLFSKNRNYEMSVHLAGINAKLLIYQAKDETMEDGTIEDEKLDRLKIVLTDIPAGCGLEEVILFRVPLARMQNEVGSRHLTMMVNSENINNGTAGLVHLTDAGDRSSEAEPYTRSQWWTIIGSPESSRYWLFGFRTPIKHRTFLRTQDGYFECGCYVQHILTENTFETDELTVFEGRNPNELVEKFGDMCASLTPGRFNFKRELGWNSWDYYFSCFEEEDLQENLDVISMRNQELADKVKYVVIDMGWYTDFGDWRANGRFSSGIEKAAKDIASRGFIPGIWVAPFYVSWDTKLYLRNNEACVRDGNSTGDRPIRTSGLYLLDPTHPLGERYLFNWFRSLRNVGFKYFKIDFVHYLVSAEKNAKFYKNHMGRIEIVRRGMEIIRDAIGDDSYLLACGCQPEAVIGIVDACRIGGDASTYHSTAKLQAQFLACRYWMNNRFWINDPDFLMVRGKATADDVHHNPYHGKELIDSFGSRSGPQWENENEPRIWATLVSMSGGALTLADHLGKLNEKGLEIINKAISNATDEAARPLDMMEKLHPEIWYRSGKKPALAIVNWDDEQRDIVLSLKKYPELKLFNGVLDIWTNNELKIDERYCVISIKPRDVAWFVIGK